MACDWGLTMRLRFLCFCVLAWVTFAFTGNAAAETPAESVKAVDFQRDVQPLFRRHCYRCHGQTKSEGGFRLTRRAEALGKGDSGESIIAPKHPEKSLILTRLTNESYGDVMPLDSESLSANEIAVIKRWIETGADWPDDLAEDRHWAYIKPARPKLPKVQNENWPAGAIDHFVLSRLEREGLAPSDPAEKARLIRRVSLALIGLPPSPEEVEAFIKDDSPEAYENLVDRLLASKRYGERWATHWLDLARYADSNGFQADQLRDSWAYRDWVIDAFNKDQPFDQFTIEQLAGDLLPEATLEQKIATGFHRTPTCNVEAGVHPEANRVNQVFDRVNTTGIVFLGTTMECCQCHDHKYDPFTQQDYYRLFAYFNNTPLEVELNSGVQYNFVGPTMALPLSPDKANQRARLLAEKETLEAELKTATLQQQKDFGDWEKEILQALETRPAEWTVQPIKQFATTGGEDFEALDDGSVLISGSLPSTTQYKIRIEGPIRDLIGFKLEALTHDSLPGKGPGRGDAERTNFILSEFAVSVDRQTGEPQAVALTGAKADFSQANWDVAGAIDGDRKTGWAIAPEFHKPHWAEFRTEEPLEVAAGEVLELTLDQNFGRGRTIGRVRISTLTGSPLTADLPEDVVTLLKKSKRNPKERKRLEDFYAQSNPKLKKLAAQIKRLGDQLKNVQPEETLVMVEMEEPRETHLLNRGNYLDPGAKVNPGTPASLHPLDPKLPANRLGLAKWLIDPDNPLVARVTVNRFWAELFGQGLVSTEEDFGTQSEYPTHPELLDWLAVEFVESGWSVKHIHKLMVMSNTFHQSARLTPELIKRDPENRLLARGPRFRLPAETIRDNALAVSGLLETKMHGPPIMPYQPDGIWRAVGRNQPTWKTAADEDRFRRGVYVVWKRGAPYPSFVNFDAPDRAACTVQRPRTNTPLQALTLLNDPAYAEMAMALAQRMLTEPEDKFLESRLRYGFRLCVSREPNAKELEILKRLLAAEQAKLKENPKLAEARLKNLLPSVRDENVDHNELAAWFAVANALLNLDETMSL
jgi:mono/diheme cytochrome c family protein